MVTFWRDARNTEKVRLRKFLHTKKGRIYDTKVGTNNQAVLLLLLLLCFDWLFKSSGPILQLSGIRGKFLNAIGAFWVNPLPTSEHNGEIYASIIDELFIYNSFSFSRHRTYLIIQPQWVMPFSLLSGVSSFFRWYTLFIIT